MLTSDDLNFRLSRMREAGLHTYLIKPVKRAELLEKIVLLLSATGAEQPVPEPAEPPAAPGDAIPLRILLAEDAPDNRFLIQAYLKKLPYRIEIAENARSRSRKLKATRPDLVLMDVQKTGDLCSHGRKGFTRFSASGGLHVATVSRIRGGRVLVPLCADLPGVATADSISGDRGPKTARLGPPRRT
jgi:hypothetical protein